MIRLVYLRFIWNNHRGFALYSLLVMAILQFLIVRLVTTLDYAPIIMALLEQVPDRFRELLGENVASRLTVEGAAAFGFNHPLVLALLAMNAINIPNRHIAGEIETGTLELLLAYPFKRISLVLSLWTSSVLLLLLMIAGALAVSLTAISLFHQLTWLLFTRMLQIGSNLWLLFVLITSISMLISTFGKEGSKTGMRAAGIILVFYLFYYLSSLWDVIEVTTNFNIFNYYQPLGLMSGQVSFWLNCAVLLALIGICLAISLRRFNRRDIPG